ncbi:MAG: histidine triad nucleotide-binding protein [Chlamydiae bacterium RIFCSPHIGHO2_12_FULL_44_59]|nr:MAG: histidine triad nucleotide-binding protein [Chlamydiae bacterium RIFCSPHIGHO2_01_FULL_44_39]OGN57088.1 MAG: histidine triad nucleotide-binding protein [Chlamydiae bacterium RIFCSPHIGHO2_02_FULL_45_9]OGN60783.1 MAG: histidine triad nucleotide-binding protein [Chlamydiae bacterium RIFCSPHIGHO2_12_FULL_44_59]OGN66984.1 MAG: histidine triad nucleotide-binding protein [Chlamydiae bacterium RIFCSPLOWO2_01_FULL_44_52]OGN67596.1 MAG: histidine triad nucleotide-binding protein [Chlamydiae bacter
MSTIFGKIIQGKLPARKVFENERILAIEDIHPIAPVHILIMPKQEIAKIQDVKDYDLIVEIIRVAQAIAKEKGIEDGYRLLTNNGSDAGQEIYHLHFHLIGGRTLGALG